MKLVLFAVSLIASIYKSSEAATENRTSQVKLITVDEGDSFVVPCDLMRAAQAWLINGLAYGISSLQFNQFGQSDFGDFNVLNLTATERLNNSMFQCFYHTGNGLDVKVGVTYQVLVTDIAGYSPSEKPHTDSIIIDLDHRKLDFGKREKFIAWFIKNDTTAMTLCPGANYTLNFYQGYQSNQIYRSFEAGSNTSITIMSGEFQDSIGELLNFEIQAKDREGNICPTINPWRFQIPPKEITHQFYVISGSEFCIPAPPLTTVLWPICRECNDGDARNFCRCLISHVAECFCNINSTYFVDNYTMSYEFELLFCLKNLTTEMNDTHIYFVNETHCNDSEAVVSSSSGCFNILYVSAARITIGSSEEICACINQKITVHLGPLRVSTEKTTATLEFNCTEQSEPRLSEIFNVTTIINPLNEINKTLTVSTACLPEITQTFTGLSPQTEYNVSVTVVWQQNDREIDEAVVSCTLSNVTIKFKTKAGNRPTTKIIIGIVVGGILIITVATVAVLLYLRREFYGWNNYEVRNVID